MSENLGPLMTPFHQRTAANNNFNDWTARGVFTVPAVFGSTAHEAVAARLSAIMADVTPLSRLWLRGGGAAPLLHAACGVDVAAMADGEARSVFWSNDYGAVRGTGVLARFSANAFLLASFAPDTNWFAAAATRFGAELFDETRHRGVLLIAGPAASRIMAEAGLAHAARFDPLQQAMMSWRGKTVTVSRWLVRDGFEITCSAADASEIFDRLHDSGRPHGLVLAGQSALDLMLLEQATLVPGRDFTVARDDEAREPSAGSLRLTAEKSARIVAGIEWDEEEGEIPRFVFRDAGKHPGSGFTPEFLARLQDGAGEILSAAWSPALRRMIALAMVDRDLATPGTPLLIRRITRSGVQNIPVRVVKLPFLG